MIVKYKKDSFLMKATDVLLKVITFGQMKNFMTDFVTTVGETVYVPTAWGDWPAQTRQQILYHENVHILQSQRDGKVKFALSYVFWPFPTIWANSRLQYEVEAYAADIVFAYRNFGHPLFDGRFNAVVELMTGPSYFWTSLDKKKVGAMLLDCITKELKKQPPL